MNRLRVRHLMLLAIILSLVPRLSFGIGLEVAGGYWGQNPSGDIQFEADSQNDILDLEEDLKYDEEYRPFGRVKADMPLFLPNIYLMATPMKFEETGSKDVSFKFGDETFNADEPFDSKLKLDHYDIALFYSIPFLEITTLKKLNAEIGVNVRIIDLEVELNQETTDLSESEHLTLPVPMLYVGIQLRPADLLSIEGEGRGIAYNSDHYYDLIGRVKIEPFGPFFIAGGYRYEKIEFDHSDIEVSMEFKGPFIEVGFDFL